MKHLLSILLALFPLFVMGQSQDLHKEEPFWVQGYFKEMGNSYLEVVSAFDYNRETARQKAVKEVIGRRSLATGAEAKVSIEGSQVSVVSEHNVIVKSRIIDEYVLASSTGYTVFLLVQTAKNPTFTYEAVSLTNRYKVGARPFLPGAAQIYKGSKAKGYSIIALQAASIASIILCENQRSSYASKMKSASKVSHVKTYAGKAADWKTARNVSIGLATGIYVYNLIDGFVAKGKMRISVDHAGGGSLSVDPILSPYAAGLSLAYRF